MVDAPTLVSHRDIIEREGGSAAVARQVSKHEEEAGRKPVDANLVQAWKRGDSIPSAYFEAFVTSEMSTYEELSAAAAARRARAA
jgi:hypothetical protein